MRGKKRIGLLFLLIAVVVGGGGLLLAQKALHKTSCNQVNHLIPTRVLVKGGEITCKILK